MKSLQNRLYLQTIIKNMYQATRMHTHSKSVLNIFLKSTVNTGFVFFLFSDPWGVFIVFQNFSSDITNSKIFIIFIKQNFYKYKIYYMQVFG